MGQSRVILVDDHALVRSALRRALSDSDDICVVGGAGTSEEAVQLISERSADVALVDIELPTRGGLWLISEARQLRPDLATVALTAHDDASHIRAAFAAGVAGFVSKREPISALRAAIHRVAAGGTFVTSVYHGPAVASAPPSLSEREVDVVRLVAMSYSNKEIAAKLGVSTKTVETYRSRAMAKLRLISRHDVYLYAFETGLLDPRPGWG